MKSPPFNYHRPATIDQALSLLATYGDDAKILAGGQSLLPVMALRLGRPEHLIDIGTIAGLASISVEVETLTIAAMVRHREAERSPVVAEYAPLVSAALPHVGHRAIRTRGTVVGSIAHADAAAEMPAVCLAADATMNIASTRGTRQVPARDFFQGYFTTALQADELLTGVSFERPAPNTGVAVVEVSRRHGDYAMVGLACSVTMSNPGAGIIDRAALAFFGLGSQPVRVAQAEAELVGRPASEQSFAAAADAVGAAIEPVADIHASTAYRRHIAAVLTRQGLAEATARIEVAK